MYVSWLTFYKKNIFLFKFNIIINYDSESFGTKSLLKDSLKKKTPTPFYLHFIWILLFEK